jgi:adenosylmethionine-8-amino-7-oxononanoate aminotransferase
VALAEELVAAAPPGLARVFYSDDGSTAVEVALKIAYQSFANAGEPERRVFVALEGGYHGDTFGAMAVGDPDPFFASFRPLLFEVRRVPVDADAVRTALAGLGRLACGVIVEPLVQGAAGMRMHGEGFVRAVRAACDEHGVPLIADEVMVGFGRTGALFACGRAGVTPDLLCLAKGLSGGVFPIAATLATERLYEAFLSQDRARALFHGHSFTAHPIGCAAALASLRLCREERVPERLDAIGTQIEAGLRAGLDPRGRPARTLRRTGGIVAFELEAREGREGYLAGRGAAARARGLELGVLLRPLGNTLYAIPPACLEAPDAERVSEALLTLARTL